MPPVIYHIRVHGHLRPEWSEWFDGIAVTSEDNGDTTLSGPVADQPALHALLVRVRDLGLTLVSLDCLERPRNSKDEF